jgi:hypothetical protein
MDPKRPPSASCSTRRREVLAPAVVVATGAAALLGSRASKFKGRGIS